MSSQGGVFDGAADADDGDTSTTQRRAASASDIVPAVTCKKISHLVSADSFLGGRRPWLAALDAPLGEAEEPVSLG